jgi:hypothetical protein
MYTTHVQPTIIYLLLALILYVKNKKVLSYAVISLSLMSYESGILPFFIAPMFSNAWNRALIKKMAIHSSILLGMMAIIIFIRSTLQGAGDGDIRIFLQSPIEILRRVLFSMMIGPYTSIKSFIFGPALLFKDIIKGQSIISAANLLAIIPIFIFLSWLFLKFFVPSDKKIKTLKEDLLTIQAFKLAILGAIALVLSYAMAFTHYPPKQLIGTGTTIHTGATFAWALLAPGLFGLFFCQINNTGIKKITCVVLSAYLSILVLFHISIQSDYVRSATIQSNFWNSVINLCPDLTEGTVIFYDRNDIIEMESITTFSWAISVTLEQLYQFPKDWKNPPRAFPVPKNDEVSFKENSITWLVPKARWWAHWDNTPVNKIIHLRHENGTWVRKKELHLNGKVFELSVPTTKSINVYPKGLIWDNFQNR